MPLEGFDPHENMRAIRIQSERPDIIPLRDMSSFVGNVVTYDCEKGNCVGIALKKTDLVAVQYAELEAGTVFPLHTHIGNTEFAIVVTGELFTIRDGQTQSTKPGEVVATQPGHSHSHYCDVATTLIAVTVPASEGYPNER